MFICFITTGFQHVINGQIQSLYEKINSFLVLAPVFGVRVDASFHQRRQMGAEKDAAGERREEVGGGVEDEMRRDGRKDGNEEERVKEGRVMKEQRMERC